MFERPILFYSEYCNFSKTFINNMLKHPEIFEEFIRINIDIDPETNQRPFIFYKIQQELNHKIVEIPTIITHNGEYVLTGVEAFKWLDYQVESLKKTKDVSGFNPIEMGSFSDSYSTFGSNDLYAATEQCFKFLNKDDDKINTPVEDSPMSQDEYSRKQRERENFDSNLKQQKNNKGNNSNVNNIPMSFANQNQIDKKQEIDERLQKLLSDRDSYMPKNKRTV